MPMEDKGRSAWSERKIRHCPPPPSEFPWLVYFHGTELRKQTFYSISENRSCVRSIPELKGKKIHNSCHGWLILSTYELKTFSLFNPVTLESINLPPPDLATSDVDDINACLLSLSPSHPDSTIFIFDKQSKTISFCLLQNQCWFNHCYGEEIGVLSDCTDMDYNFLYLPISCKGKIYAVTSQREFLVSIDMNEPDSIVLQRLVQFPGLRKEILSCSRSDLVEADGDILSIMISYEKEGFHPFPEQIIDVEIHKLDLSSMSWERVVNAKNRAFFLDNGCYQRSYSVTCSEALGNRVYFLQHIYDDLFYLYHLQDCSVFTWRPFPNLPGHNMAPVWVLPERLALVSGKEQPEEEDGTKKHENEDHETEKQDNEANGTQWIKQLSFDVLRDIHDRLTFLDYMSFRSVSKLCQEVAPPLDIKGAILRSETQCNSMSPWLMSANENGRVCRFTHPQICEKYSVNIPEPLQDASIWYCKDGWLLIGKERDDAFCLSFLNPFNKEVIPYPELKVIWVSDTRISYSSPPTSQNCVVVVIEAMHGRVHICKSRTTGWSLFEFENTESFSITNNYPVFANGAFYFLGSEGNLGVVRLHEESCEFEVLEQTEILEASYNEGFLAERDGEVFVVLTYDMGQRVNALKLDHSTLNWETVTTFEKYSLHVSKSSGFFTIAETSDAENRIYFPRFHGEHLVSYSLSTNSLESSGFEYPLTNYEGTTQPIFCSWIKPCRS